MSELVGIVAVVVVAWFAAGTIWNVRLGRELMRWMQSGLPILGERTTVRWLGSTAVEMVIDKGKAQFAKVTVVIFLEPRDLPWWPLSHLRGRRDTLIVRGALRRTPSVELEAVEPGSWSARDARPRIAPEWMVRQPEAASSVAVHYPDAAALTRADQMLLLGTRIGPPIKRLSVRRTEPNFQIHVALPDRRQPAREFFEAVQRLAELALSCRWRNRSQAAIGISNRPWQCCCQP
jgi:hypothetical protein